MKCNCNGYEAVEDGLNAGGIDRFLCGLSEEPLCNAEKAICEGSFFASKGYKTACVISEKDAECIPYVLRRQERLSSGFVIIILGKELSDALLRTMDNAALPVLIAENIRDIWQMTRDAAGYSELRQLPVAVFIPVSLLRSRQQATIYGTYFCDNYCGLTYGEREARIRVMEESHNAIYVSPAKKEESHCLIISMSGCTQSVREIAGAVRGVNICRMDMFGCVHYKDYMKSYGEILIIGHGSGYAEEMLNRNKIIRGKSHIVELSDNKLREMTEIWTCLQEYFHDGNKESMTEEHLLKPPLTPINDLMCTGCPYLSHIEDIHRHSAGSILYEDIYCEKRGTAVRSGLADSYSAYACDMVVTNRNTGNYHGLNICYVKERCDKNE